MKLKQLLISVVKEMCRLYVGRACLQEQLGGSGVVLEALKRLIRQMLF